MESAKQKYVFEQSVKINCKLEKIFTFHLNTNNLPKISPSFPKASVKEISDIPLKKNSKVTINLDFLLFKTDWEILIRELDPNRLIGDYQVHGLFEYWYHSHIFDLEGNKVIMKDKVEFIPPFGILGKLLLPFIKLQLKLMFNYRHKKTKLFLEN